MVMKGLNETKAFENFVPRTMSDFIYSQMKEAIINNELKPNQRINEKEIAERFRVSRTPVREAVLRLSSESFIKIDSYRRAVVSTISFEELQEILEVLAALDVLAISLVVDHLSPSEINKLEKLTEKMERFSHVKTAEKFMKANVEFHTELWKSVPNSFLREMLYLVRDKKERYAYPRLVILKSPGFLKRSISHHWELLDAIKKRDKNRLNKLIGEHHHLLIEALPMEENVNIPPAGKLARKDQSI